MTLGDVVAGTSGRLLDVDADISTAVRGASVDSRTLKPGEMFVAVQGEHTDGHLFAGDAARAGAAAVLAQRPVATGSVKIPTVVVPDTIAALAALAGYWRSRMLARVVGITGSVGKTSTKEVVAGLLAQQFVTLRSEKNLNNEIGLPLTLLRLVPETEYAVLEMGGAYRMGEITYLCSIARPSIGVVTNVGPVHLERMGTIERIAQTKAELVAALPDDGVAVLNRDDPLVAGMAAVARADVLWYGLSDQADVRADDVESSGLDGIRFRLSIGDQSGYVKAPLLGRHSVHTILAGAAAAHAAGMDFSAICAAVRLLPRGLRLVASRGPAGSTIIDDTYNASPASVLAALNLLDEIRGRHLAVLGDMAELGSFTDEAHTVVGARAARVCELLFTVGPFSRLTAESARRSGLPHSCVREFDTWEQALPAVREALREGDVMLIKGSRATELDKLSAALLSGNETRH